MCLPLITDVKKMTTTFKKHTVFEHREIKNKSDFFLDIYDMGKKLITCCQRILVVKVVPNSEKPGTFLFGASSL